MVFVHVEDFVHPDAGYQINVLTKLQVQQGHTVFIITADLDKIPLYLVSFFGKEDIERKDREFYEKTGVKIIRLKALGFYSGRVIFRKRLLLDNIISLHPDVLYVHGEDTLTGIMLIRSYSKLSLPIVLDCHMLEVASKNRLRNVFRFFYRKFITPIILKNNIPLIRVQETDFVEKCLGIPLSRTYLFPLGTDTSYFIADSERKRDLRKEKKLDESAFVVLYAGKLDEHKGGMFFAKSIKEKINAKREIVFLIVGNTVDEYGLEVEELFSLSENRILRFPTQKYYDLLPFYQIADLAIFPKQCSMSFFEAQSCSLPVVFEDNDLNIFRAKSGNALIFKHDDTSDFRNKIIECAEMDDSKYEVMKYNARQYVLDNYEYPKIAEKTTELMISERQRFLQNLKGK